MARELPSASLLENAQFNQLVIVPNAIQGLFRRRPTPVGVATRFNVDGRAVRLIEGIRRSHGPGPVWIRVMANRALLVLAPEDIRRVLEGSPYPFAADPEAKRKGMGHFQPYALTLSRGELWEDRRRFTEAVLDSAQSAHRLADRFAALAREEIAEPLGEGELRYEPFHAAFRRIVRRIVLGDAARDDEGLSDLLAELMSEANAMPSERSEYFDEFMEGVERYVAAAEPGSLAGLFAEAPSTPDTRVEGQVAHWLFALQDTLSANALRALALLGSHPEQRERAEGDREYLTACLQEAMRLWPTTPLLSRETLVDLTWRGAVVPAGTQVMIVNTFHHRDRERLPYADRFAPEEWITGSAKDDWTLNHFSHGPQGCPGRNLALFVGTEVLAAALERGAPQLLEPTLDPAKPLPYMLDVFRLRVGLAARAAVAAPS
jgi:cytochrome P450